MKIVSLYITTLFAVGNLAEITRWVFSTVVFFAQTVLGAKNKLYKSEKNETRAYEKLQINKTLPTPCDKEMWLFNLGDEFEPSNILSQRPSKFVCPWPYVVNKIPGTNLLFLAINMLCKLDTVLTYNNSPQPTEIIYINNTAIRQETALPCYIAIKNNYTRHIYTKCYETGKNEKHLNSNRKYCGHFWEGP